MSLLPSVAGVAENSRKHATRSWSIVATAAAVAKQCLVVGTSRLFEAYEEQLGLISAIEPSILGVGVAYGGYGAFGYLENKGFASVKLPSP